MPEQRGGGVRRLLNVLAASATAALLAAGCAQTGPGMVKAASPAQVERLGALFAQAMPIGWMVERVAARDAAWPFQQHAGKYTPAQLACTRAELTSEKVVVTQHADAREFARSHPDRVDESIRVLENGAADALGSLMRAGVNEGMTGQKSDLNSVMGKMTAAQLRGFVDLTEGSQYADLRRAMRLDGLTSSGTRAESRQRGYRIGQSLMIGPLLTAMERCGVQPASLFDKAGTPT